MDALKILLLLGAGYFGWTWYAGGATTDAGGDNGNGGNGGAGGGNGNSAASTRAALKALMRAEASKLGIGETTGGDGWNYVYQQVRGVPGPDVLVMWPGRDRAFNMTLDEYLDVAMQNGVAGLNYRRGK